MLPHEDSVKVLNKKSKGNSESYLLDKELLGESLKLRRELINSKALTKQAREKSKKCENHIRYTKAAALEVIFFITLIGMQEDISRKIKDQRDYEDKRTTIECKDPKK